MEFKDYYAVLGVPREAGADEIKKSYRKLARKYHPDVSKEPDAAARMSEVNEAYNVLSDAEKRAAYDNLGRGHRSGESFTPPPGWDAGFEFSGSGVDGAEAGDFSDFFSELFGRMHSRGGRASAHAGPGGALRGDDHHAKIVLDLEDAWRGVQTQVSLQAPQFDGQGRLQLVRRTLEVKIPAGVKPGQLIRLAGQGGAGHGGAAAGDLMLEVEIAPHPRFRLDGANVVAELPLAPWEAALGAVVPVALPDGQSLKVRVPSGAQSGQVLTVRGKGLPSRPPGDLELQLRVVLPSAHDPRAKRAYEQMAAELAPEFDARKVAAAETVRQKENER
ncbi:MAG TPA: DnaJ C-terminal domain-containing protein [Burkholderiaceae bacterium]|nr:DnaJ C-terminal domain-containing protein [Burkholderiaceae bacterium]